MRLIDADKLPVVTEWCVDEAGFGASFHVVHEEDINKAPTIDPESLRPQGEWAIKCDEYDCEYAVCSCCGAEFYALDEDTIDMTYNYCPDCGVKMKGAGNNA